MKTRGGGSNPEISTYECPANSHYNESCSNSLVCIGQCECENGFKAELGACKKISTSGGNNLDNNGPLHSSVSCPEHSSEASDGTGDILDGACTCGANYVPNADGNACTTCAAMVPNSVYKKATSMNPVADPAYLVVPTRRAQFSKYCKCDNDYYAFKENASSPVQCINMTNAATKCGQVNVWGNYTHQWDADSKVCKDNCTNILPQNAGSSTIGAHFDPMAVLVPNSGCVDFAYQGIVIPGCRCNNWTNYSGTQALCTNTNLAEFACQSPKVWDSDNPEQRTKCYMISSGCPLDTL